MTSVVMAEAYESRTGGIGGSNSFELNYYVFNDDFSTLSEIDASTYVAANRPTTYRGFDYQGYTYDQVVLNVYLFHLTYGSNQNQTTTATSTLQFNIGGGTQHITTSLSKTDYRDTAIWPSAHDFKGLIGIDLGADGKRTSLP